MKMCVLNEEQLLKYGLSFDNDELAFYKRLFKSLKRYPRYLELYDLSQSNSEHSRHWFFNGEHYINSKLQPNLFKMIKSTLSTKYNSLVAFSDNSSVISGFNTDMYRSYINSKKTYNCDVHLDLVLTAETHNFPTLISPFEGAATGIGGRIRDNHATGTGAYLLSSLAGYCVGNLDFNESKKNVYGYNNAVNILVEASNGASDYGNKLGEPIIGGFTRGFGINLHLSNDNGNVNDNNNNNDKYEKREWIKPIMFSVV